jgi:hypothetical protein
MALRYGLTRNELGAITVDPKQAATINLIYNLYLQGKSLGGIVDELKSQGIPSPAGKPSRVRAAVDSILSNGRYVPWIVSEDQFWQTQIEQEHRTDLDADNRTRKAARYSLQNVLSGLLICGNCGRNFRRITRPSGEVVWCCADKVENGKRASCSNTVTISDEDVKALVCEHLGLAAFDEEAVREAVDVVEIGADGVTVQMKTAMAFGEMAM